MIPLIFCIYHAGCTDGAAAAGIVLAHCPSANMHAANYGEPLPIIPSGTEEIMIVDFSYGREALALLCTMVPRVVVVDHHKNAMQALTGWDDKPENLEIVFDENQSGALLTWRHFNGLDDVPHLVRTADDYDRWQLLQGDTKSLSAMLRGKRPSWWANSGLRASDSLIRELTVKGGAIVEEEAGTVNRLTLTARRMHVKDFHDGILTVNTPVLQNEVCQSIMRYYNVPVAMAYYDDDRKRKFSIRSDGSIDVAAIARRYGGNGHDRAAGFSVELGSSVVL